MRKKLRSPQTVVRKRKRSSPQQIIPNALKSSPVSPLRSIKTSRSSTSPKVRVTHENPSDLEEALNLLQVSPMHHIFNTIATESHVAVIDSGASMSGTGDRATLKNLRPTTQTVSSAFGESAQPIEMGDLQPHMIPTVLVDAMKNTTLLSISQMCG
jgi:hypothetical protein